MTIIAKSGNVLYNNYILSVNLLLFQIDNKLREIIQVDMEHLPICIIEYQRFKKCHGLEITCKLPFHMCVVRIAYRFDRM